MLDPTKLPQPPDNFPSAEMIATLPADFVVAMKESPALRQATHLIMLDELERREEWIWEGGVQPPRHGKTVRALIAEAK